MIYDLPTTVSINGIEYAIRSDYRAILDICVALNDPTISNEDKAYIALYIFYPNFDEISSSDYEEAIRQCFNFIDMNECPNATKSPKLMDWEQDFKYIIAPINRIMGRDIRAIEDIHWWTFLSAFYEIGDCTFAQIVRIRDMKARGKTLSKEDRQWYNRNRDIVDIKTIYTENENEIMREWGVK